MHKTAMEVKFYLIHVFKWFKRFREGHEDPATDPRTEQPSNVRNPETAAKFRELVARDCQMPKILTEGQLHINWETI